MIILVLMIFYRQSAIIPILHYNMIISEEAAFLIKAGLTGLMIISAAKRRFHYYKNHIDVVRAEAALKRSLARLGAVR